MQCEYGCGQEALFQLKNGKHICSKSSSGCPVNKAKNAESIKKAHKEGRCLGWKSLPYNSGWGWNKNKMLIPFEDVFNEHSSYDTGYARKHLITQNLKEYKCEQCGISSWNNKDLTLELNHKNGNNRDHRLENLEFLCPNCHSQTDTWRGKNINGHQKVSEDELKQALIEEKNIRSALLKVGLAAKGANYDKAKRIKMKYDIL